MSIDIINFHFQSNVRDLFLDQNEFSGQRCFMRKRFRSKTFSEYHTVVTYK